MIDEHTFVKASALVLIEESVSELESPELVPYNTLHGRTQGSTRDGLFAQGSGEKVYVLGRTEAIRYQDSHYVITDLKRPVIGQRPDFLETITHFRGP